ncbi:uncharacterized protein [Haliotis asinina]|uniref:uncharacterized protein isoform X2 n=1 Tax=Haliotis asinina TaxID=109174 RepID=UPI0035324ACC
MMVPLEWTLWCICLFLLHKSRNVATASVINSVGGQLGEPTNVLVVETNVVVSGCHDDDDDDDDDDDNKGCADSAVDIPVVPPFNEDPTTTPRSSRTIIVADLSSSNDSHVVSLTDPPITTESTTPSTTGSVATSSSTPSTAAPNSARMTSSFTSTVRITTPVSSTSLSTPTAANSPPATATTTSNSFLTTAAHSPPPATATTTSHSPITTAATSTTITPKITKTTTAATTPLPASASNTTPRVKTTEDICKGCVMTNGVGYAPHPTDCSRFYQCYHNNVSILSSERSCSPGLYWNQAALTCDFPANVQCVQDECSTGRAVSVDCRNYWDCTTGSATVKCCPLYQSYDITSGSCKTNVTCSVSCLMEKTIHDVPCDLRPVPGDKHVFEQWTPQGTWVRHRCPLFTEYSKGNCGCAYLAPQNYNKACRPEMYLPFDDNTDDMSGNSVHVANEGVTVTHGSAVFDGQSRLVVNRFSNAWFGSTLVVTLRFKVAGPKSRHALVCNGDCRVGPSIYIGSNSDSTTEFFGKTYSSPAVNFTLPQSVSGWQEVEYILQGGVLQGLAAGVWSSQNTTGALETRQRALIIGGCTGADRFQGSIDELAVYFCNPRTP